MISRTSHNSGKLQDIHLDISLLIWDTRSGSKNDDLQSLGLSTDRNDRPYYLERTGQYFGTIIFGHLLTTKGQIISGISKERQEEPFLRTDCEKPSTEKLLVEL